MGAPQTPIIKSSKTPKPKSLLSNIPSHLIGEILSWLPAKSIIQSKLVCKLWLHLISHPHFISLQSSRARPGLIIHHSEISRKYFRIADFDDTYGHQDHLPRDTMFRLKLSPLSSFQDSNIVVDGSTNGLLFLRDINYKHETLYVCNPMTREYITLPQPDGVVRYPCVVTHGFGISNKGKEYKVVRVFHDREIDPNTRSCLRVPYFSCQVYTLGSGGWRSVVVTLPSFCYDSRYVGVFFKGNVHWLVQDLEGDEMISCFDLESETFKPLPCPSSLKEGRVRKVLGSLGVLKGCLCLCDNGLESDIEIWVMREYGVKKSWVKDIVIKKMKVLRGPSFEVVYALKVFGDGKVMILWGDFFMVYLCGKSDEGQEVDVEQPNGPNSIEAMQYAPTFISLGRFGKECVSVF